MRMRKNGFFTPWLEPGEQMRPKAKGLQPLKGLNAKAVKGYEKVKHRAKAPVKKNICFAPLFKTWNLLFTPDGRINKCFIL
jgi:hypothetical protein